MLTVWVVWPEETSNYFQKSLIKTLCKGERNGSVGGLFSTDDHTATIL